MPNDSSSVSVSTSSIHNPLINNPIVQDPISSLDPATIAKSAVGKGVTHQYHPSSSSSSNVSNNLINNGIPTDSSNRFTFLDPSQLGMGIESCLSELKNNFRNSLNEAAKMDEAKNNTDNIENSSSSFFPQFSSLTRESSLVDLAIIPSLHTTQSQANFFSSAMNDKTLESDYGMTFIDFPEGVDPNSMPPCDD